MSLMDNIPLPYKTPEEKEKYELNKLINCYIKECNITLITLLKGIVVIKRTGIIKCFIRTIKRDFPNKYFLNKEIEKIIHDLDD